MANKTLAFLGLFSYVLGVIGSNRSYFLLVIAGFLQIIFIFIAINRLWKKAKVVSRTLLGSFIIFAILYFIRISPSSGKLIITLLNIAYTIHLISFFWAIITLYMSKTTLQKTNNEEKE
jgi:succinate-acetate transporter protein